MEYFQVFPKQKLKLEWQAFWLSVGFLTRIPMLVRIDYSQRLMNQSSLYFPLVGLLLGAFYALTYGLLALAFSSVVAIILVVILHLFVTGAFHEDGLADSIDALGGGYTVEKRLAIMKDSRIGTYGAAALTMALLLKVTLLAEADTIWLALLVAPSISRLTPLLLMATLNYVTDASNSKSKPVADGFSRQRLLVAVGFTLMVAAAMSFWHPLLFAGALSAVILTAFCWGAYLRQQLGGYTGDALGASVILSELVLLLFL
ncbi:adenosylcobinamide-GDP ribazoletransferase [Marinobacter halophilus]|uniref:Adenosylcobinamide-GDP ribazoletransferase n=1 Tax=Marinobacter halophilus TaxID=1323740 RepID=A0A2T1KJ20_9GAMM|nr:adenosylcobinamide-GDP ribazoletransferase [Marinobacter halophilus]PSF10177.1 adenosylcobinamide-GDP ribazoletransferase [Marinobacter halophilus]GGC68389.1 adenosylcobinamide-GDP ribazoletransferase [Marinobacter halophilus]